MCALVFDSAGWEPEALGAKCSACPFKVRYRPVPPRLSSHPKLILLGESPGDNERLKLEPFVGPTGKALFRELRLLGLTRDDCHITNAAACQPPPNASDGDKVKAAACCKPRLEAELASLPAEVPLFAMGKPALYAARGTTWLNKMWGESFWCSLGGKTRYALSAWHPTFVYWRVPSLKPVFSRLLDRCANKRRDSWGEIHTELTVYAMQTLEDWWAKPRRLAIDIENSPGRNVVMCIGLSDGKQAVSVPWHSYGALVKGVGHHVVGWAELGESGARAAKLVRDIVLRGSEDGSLIAHNGAFDSRYLSQLFGSPVKFGFDTMFAHAVYAPQRMHNLEDVALERFAVERWKRNFKADSDAKGDDKFVDRDELDLREYNAKDAMITYWIAEEWLRPGLLEINNGWDLYDNYVWQQSIAEEATREGIEVSRQKCEEHRQTLEGRRALVLTKVRELVGDPDFNPRSVKQLRALFVDRLKAPVLEESETGEASFNEAVLSQYIYDFASLHPQAALIAKELLKYRQLDKLIGTYLTGIVRSLDEANKVHPIFNVHGAQSGRWSSFIHTLPKPAEDQDGNAVTGMRDVFVTSEPWHFVAADYSALELRLIALIAGDEPFLTAFEAGQDVHAIQCAKLFGARFTDATDLKLKKRLRDITKMVNYKVSYSAMNLRKCVESTWQQLRVTYPTITLDVVEFVVTGFFRDHKAIEEWRKRQFIEDAKRDFSEDPWSGRRRYYYGQPEDTKIFNWYGQAPAAEVIRRGMKNVLKEVDKDHDKLLIQWHDDLTFRTTDPVRLAEILERGMAITLEYQGRKLKFPVEVKVGTNLGALLPVDKWREKHVGTS